MRVLSSVILLIFTVASHAAERQTFQTVIQWTLSLDAEGKVESMKPVDRDHFPDLRRQIEPLVRAWHFTPGKLDGRSAPTETTLGVSVELAAESTNALSYHGRLVGASTGGTFRHVVKPQYPAHAIVAHDEGEVMLRIEYDSNGVVTSARAVPEMSADHVSAELTDAALGAVRKWTFKPETVGGRGIASAALVPICFKMSEEHCQWKPRPGSVDPIRSGDAIALSSVVGVDTGDEKHLP